MRLRLLILLALTLFAASSHAEEEPILYRVVQVATEADYEFTTAQGGTTVTNNIMRSIIADVSALTEAQLGVRLVVVHQRSYATPGDPYQSTIASEIEAELQTRLVNTYANGASHDVAFLFSGKDVGADGDVTIGSSTTLGWSGITQPGEAVIQIGGDRQLRTRTARELGHMLGASYSSGSGHIMGANPDELTNFAPLSITQITTSPILFGATTSPLQRVTRRNVGPRIPRSLNIELRPTLEMPFQISLSWQPPEGGATAEFYQLFRSTSATACAGTPYADNIGGEYAGERSVVPGILYYYSLRAVNENGAGPCLGPQTISGESDWASLSPQLADQSTATSSRLRLSWSWSSWYAREITAQIFRTTNAANQGCGGTTFVEVPNVYGESRAEYIDTTAVRGTEYYYSLRLVRPALAAGPCVTADFLRPAAPNTWLNDETAAIRWSNTLPHSLPENGVVEGGYFEVLRSPDANTDSAQASLLATLDSTTTAYLDSTLPLDGNYYRFFVRACNLAGCTNGLNSVRAGRLVDGNPIWIIPSVPRNVRASQGTAEEITISWDPPAVGLPTTYEILYSLISPNGPYSLSGYGSPSPTHYTFTPYPLNSANWYIVVRAQNSTGDGPLSAPVTGWSLQPPTNVQASRGTYVDRIRITWTPARSATGYRIIRQSPTAATFTINSGATSQFEDLSPSLSGAFTSYSIVALNGDSASRPVTAVGWVNNEPIITQEPQNVSTFAPNSATFSITAIAGRPISYQWLRNSVEIPGATSATYTLQQTSPTDNGVTFQCRVSTPAPGGTALSAAARLYAIGAPQNIQASLDRTNDVLVAWSYSGPTFPAEVFRSSTASVCSGAPIAGTPDTAAVPGRDYYYSARLLHNVIGAGPCSAAVVGARQLLAPTFAASDNQPNEIQLSWSAVAGALRYNLYRRLDGQASCSTDNLWRANVTALSAVDSSAQPDRSIGYAISAIGENGRLGRCQVDMGVRNQESSSTNSASSSSSVSSTVSSAVSSAVSSLASSSTFFTSTGVASSSVSSQSSSASSPPPQPLFQLGCAGANGFLQQINIASVLNKKTRPIRTEVVYRDLRGQEMGRIGAVIQSNLKLDFIINDLGLEPDTYGTVCVEADTRDASDWSGVMNIYKPNTRQGDQPFGTSMDFALTYPFTAPETYERYLPLNTFHLGTPAAHTVANWISISDAQPNDGEGLSGVLRYVNDRGDSIGETQVAIPDGGRRDFAAHDALTGGDNHDAIGMAIFVPTLRSNGSLARYYLTNIRYFYDCAGGCSNLRTAFFVPQQNAELTAVIGSASTKRGETSIVEIQNPDTLSARASLSVYSAAGQLLRAETVEIPGMATRHVIMNRVGVSGFVDAESDAAVEVTPLSSPLIVRTFGYKLDQSGNLEYGYALPTERAGNRGSPRKLGQFNSFIQHENTVELINSRPEPLEVNVDVLAFDGTPLTSHLFQLAGHATARQVLELPVSTYGSIVFQGSGRGFLARVYVNRPGEYVLPYRAE